MLFWKQELKYALPTPVPRAYIPVMLQTSIRLPEAVNAPVFLHFFNPECPCSRFNRKYFNQLIYQYKDKIKFKVVIPPYASLEDAKSFFDSDVEVILDTHGWAKACGVYATPQAVIIDEKSQLFYRGNYNRTRYCTDPSTNYAEQALQAFVNKQPLPPSAMDELARRAYGCSFTEEL
jgi:hypothetical protein